MRGFVLLAALLVSDAICTATGKQLNLGPGKKALYWITMFGFVADAIELMSRL